jgi:VIT1/CCC1 family predicted Fe2+/Mn2+ transporter
MTLFDDHTRERYVFISVALLLFASITALLMYVPILPMALAIVIVLALVLMFAFGFYVGNKEQTPPRDRATSNL